jgi:ATP-binding cassette subfamily C protein
MKLPVSLRVIIFARLLPMIDTLHRHYQSHLHMLPAFITIHELEARYRAAAEMPGPPPAPPSTSAQSPTTGPSSHTASLTLQHGISLRNLLFRHDPNRATPTLTLDNLWLPARRTTAIIGPSGAGKSTLADLLCGLLRPEQGKIQVDGQTLEGEHRRAWRRQIAYVPQEVFLFHGTIRDNLLWANPRVDDAALWQALHQVAAADFVARLPRGLDTSVGERGIHLSGGERQRIALARALLRQPLLLILDEATSALDTGNEERIRDALAGLHGALTLVIIAHRLSTIRHADH